LALDALLSYAPRYAAVAGRAKLKFDPDAAEIVERQRGGSGTEFGVPSAPAAAEREPLRGADLERLTALLTAAWATFDSAAKEAVGVELRKGPRGGGRDLDKIIGHVREAEVAYLGQLGSRPPASGDEPPDEPMKLLRRAYLDTLAAIAEGRPLADPRRTQKPWPARYAIRRSAWHVLDHAWEIEDRSRP
jgi:hypothetical protein